MKGIPIKLNNLTKPNLRYYHDLHRFICIPAGRRSRKDLIGVRKMLVDPERGAFNQLPDKPYLYIFGAPVQNQAKAIFWETLKRDTKLFQARVRESSPPTITLTNGSQLMVTGLDKPERIEGITYPPVRGILITEIPNCKPDMWSAHVRPILSDNNGFAILNGVPEGLNHWHDMCLIACGGTLPKLAAKVGAYAECGQWSYHSWFSADVLPAEEIEEARRTMDARTFRQEYEASFENVEGLAYYAFSDRNIKKVDRKPNMSIDIGMDFNVNPMTSCEGHLIDGAFKQFGESVLINSNTYEIAEHLIAKYNLKRGADGILSATIYPDATGKNRESNARYTDLQILRKAGFKIKAHKSNPLQPDRINAMNSAMNPMEGTPKYFVDPSCKNTIDEYSHVQRLSDGRLDKTQEEEGKPRVHLSDAVGYLISYNFPINELQSWDVTSA